MKRIYLALGLILVLLVPTSASAALVFDATSSGTTGGATSSTLTISHTVTTTANGMLLFSFMWDDTFRTITSVTYNGTAMTQAARQDNANQSLGMATYYLAAPATGAHNLVLTLNGAARIRGSGISFAGAASSTGATSTADTGAGTTTSSTLSLTTTKAGSYLVSSLDSLATGATFTLGGGLTQIASFASTTLATFVSGYKLVPTAGATSSVYSWTNAHENSHIAVEVKDAASVSTRSRLVGVGIAR